MLRKCVYNTLVIEEMFRNNPQIRNIPIKRPIFIVGFPRTGTTLLQNLFSLTDRETALRFFELNNPAPHHQDHMEDLKSRLTEMATVLRVNKQTTGPSL